MAHYTGPKARINRRLGMPIYESAGALRALENKPNPPGMHVRRKPPSTYGLALMEKQKLKHIYGLGERSLVRLFTEAQRRDGDTGITLLRLCELQLASVIARSGLVKTRPQARQGVTHGHFLVNGTKVDKPSYRVRPGDVITVKDRPTLLELYRPIAAGNDREIPHWLSLAAEELRIHVLANPDDGDCPFPLQMKLVVEFLSR